MNREFKIGDRVRIIECITGNSIHNQKIGYLKNFNRSFYDVDIGNYVCTAITIELIDEQSDYSENLGTYWTKETKSQLKGV